MATPDALSIALIGRYRAPRYRYGETVTDSIRGDVIVTRTSDAPIPWPMGKIPGSRKPGLVIVAGLEKALRTESALAICHHWGITPQTVSKWRGLLGIDQKTAGARLLRQNRLTPHLNTARALIDYTKPERGQKIADAKRGKPRPKHVIEALRSANVGRPLSEDHRRKIGEASRRNGIRPPKAGRAWTAEEDALLHGKTAADVAKATGRTLRAVYDRRHVLGISDGRTRRHRRQSG